MHRIRCYSLFDITATGVTRHLKSTAIPMTDRAGQDILNEAGWHRSRNQQRNWETILQLLSLRTQPMQFKDPVIAEFDNVIQLGLGAHYRGLQMVWTFEFAVEVDKIYHRDGDDLFLLREDSQQVPMILGLNETAEDMPAYIAQDPVFCNVAFQMLDGK